MQSRRLSVNHQVYDHVDEEQEHHVHVEELNKIKNRTKKFLNEFFSYRFLLL